MDKIKNTKKIFFTLIFCFLLYIIILGQDKNSDKTENTKNPMKDKSSSSGGGKNTPAIPVKAAKALREDIPIQIKAIGTVEASSNVSIKSQVGGILNEIHFKEGQEIKKGDILFTIDKRSYEVLLHKEEANQKKNIIEEKNAQENYLRLDELYKKNIVTKEEVDNARTAAETKKAQLDIDKAAVEYARLQVEYCSIKSPIEGIIGDILIDIGNLIKANDTSLISINTINPVYVSFSVPEVNLPEIQKYLKENKKLIVSAIIKGNESNSEDGDLTFIDNQIDRNTGTIKLKGTFNNKNKILWPGQFVNVILNLTIKEASIVVPSEAIQVGQDGLYVYIIKPDKSVENKPIIQGIIFNGKTVIESGIDEGDTIVTDGHLRIAPGSKVEIKEDNN